MSKEMKIDLMKDFTEEEVAALTPSVSLHTHEDEIVKMYLAREQVKHIAEQFSVSTATVYKILAAKGVKLQRKSSGMRTLAEITEEDKELVIKDYNAKKSVLGIMAKRNINKAAFYKILDDAGIDRRVSNGNRKKKEVTEESYTKDLPTAIAPGAIQLYEADGVLHVKITRQAQTKFSSIVFDYEV